MSRILFENDQICVTEEETLTYFGSEEHCNFPSYVKLPNGDIYIGHGMGEHTVTERRHVICSRDSGQSWEEVADKPQVVLADGTCLQVGFRGEKPDGNTFRFHVRRSGNNWKEVEDYEAMITFPFEIEGVWCHGRYIELCDGMVLAGLYGYAKGDQKYSTWVMASSDKGRNWEYQGMVAQPPYPAGTGREGACEAALEELANGEIVCVMRTGGRSQDSMLQARSTEKGKTWFEPVLLNTPGGVDPSLLLLENGILVCAFGRPNISLMFSTAGDAGDWTKPVAFYRGSGDHYTWLWPTGRNRFLLMWCCSGFCKQNIEERNEVRSTEFSVEIRG